MSKPKTDTEKAIKWLRSHFELGIYTLKAEGVITLLQQGEKAKKENIILKKYEVMWKSIINASKCLIDKEGRKILKQVIKDIKQGMKESQKYFQEKVK